MRAWNDSLDALMRLPNLRSFAEREFEISLTTYDRRNIEYPDGRHDEINIYAEGRKDDEEVILIGEAADENRFVDEPGRSLFPPDSIGRYPVAMSSPREDATSEFIRGHDEFELTDGAVEPDEVDL